MSSDFQIAHDRAQIRAGERVWKEMTSRERVDAIYEELRAVDAARLAGQPLTDP